MSFKIAFIGAGSIGFTRTLLADLLSVPEFSNIEVAFTDINEKNLDMVRQLCQRDIKENGLKIKISATTDRRSALKGAKYVVNTTRIGGLEAFATDVEIPLKYGIDQCVGDTLCAGGIMYGQRGIAAMMEFCKDIREVGAKDPLLLNYGNPNAMLTWAANKYGKVRTVGLCHGVQHGHTLIAKALGIKPEELDYVCAGINHQTWYISLKHKGREIGRDELIAAMEADPEISRDEKVRIDMLKRFGYFSTESNGHLSEYLPWYRKNPSRIKEWISMTTWINGETGGYLRICTESRNWFETDFPNWMKDAPKTYAQDKRSNEHGSYIIESLETGRIYRGHFNVINNGCITNLPSDAIVEVPGYVDANGMNIPIIGELPLGCAAVCNASISVQRLAVEAAITGDDYLLRQAMMMDPLTSAVCNPPEIWQMTDEMLAAQKKWLPQYKEAVKQAETRIKAGLKIKTDTKVKGAARLKVRSIEEMQKDKEAVKKTAAATAR